MGSRDLANRPPMRRRWPPRTCARKAAEHGMRTLEVEVSGPGSGRNRPYGPCKPRASRSHPSAMSPQFRTMAAGRASGGVFKDLPHQLFPPERPGANLAPLRQVICLKKGPVVIQRTGRSLSSQANSKWSRATIQNAWPQSWRAARARLWLNPRQFAAPHSFCRPCRARDYLGPYRRCLA